MPFKLISQFNLSKPALVQVHLMNFNTGVRVGHAKKTMVVNSFDI